MNKKIVEILGNQKIKVKDFADFYLNALNNLTINKIPLGVDCTFVGDICKSFFEPKKYLFVIGANSAMPTRIKDESLILSALSKEKQDQLKSLLEKLQKQWLEDHKKTSSKNTD